MATDWLWPIVALLAWCFGFTRAGRDVRKILLSEASRA